ncbi:hypothetical protein Z043_106528, partial [Scleropages formosus]
MTTDLTFEENLKQRNLLAACQQLIALEDRLFGENSCALPAEREQLETQHEVLLNQVWLVVEASLNSGEEDLEILEEVAKVIQLEEERDKQWQKAKESGTGPVPDWRPFNCRSTHDDLLSKMVKKRLDDTENLSGGDNLSSSLKKDIFKMGKCLKDDMKKVVRDVKRRYPEEFDICNLYARLYHQTFSARLLAITEFGLDLQDLIYVLYWVHSLYPNDVLQSTELKDDINSEHLGCLLPADVLRPLEDQYLSHKEGILNTWTSNALKNEEDSCLKGNLPDVFDGCYFTNIAIDVVEIFDEAAKEARSVLGDLNKAKSIAGQLNIFLASYKSFLEAVLKGRYGNILPTVKAHLASLETFSNRFKTALDALACMSMKELLGQLHKEVLAEYVSRLMKRNLKLADEDQQRTAATLVSEDNERLHALFMEAGSKEEWLRDVLSKISEVLRIQDVGFIQLEVATLVRDFPDISSLHIKALLSLKRNLSSDDIYRIKHGVKVNRSAVDSSSSRSFFSM